MNHCKINVRYAKAMYELAKENDRIDTVYRDTDLVFRLCRESDDFIQLLQNPVIKTSQKKSIIREILHPHMDEFSLRFFLLITENNREAEIPGICRNLMNRIRTGHGIVPATVTTAEPLTEEIVALIRQNLEKETGKQVELTTIVNPALLGGIIMRIEDKQYDGSISTMLKKIKSAILAK